MRRSIPWLEYDEASQGAFCKECKKRGKSLQRAGGAWITKPFINYKKAVEKMRAHSQGDIHIQSCQATLEAERVMREGSIIQQLQHVGKEEKGQQSNH